MRGNSRTAIEVAAATLSRIVLNTARRFAYPFAPALSRGLGVPLTAITSIIALNQATAVMAIFFGPLADRLGYRLMMTVGLAMLTLGMFAGGCLPFYGVILVSLFLAGMGKGVFDPAMQAFFGERVPFERRGLVIGILEIAWAASTLVGIPLLGILIEHFGWRSAFFALGGCALLSLLLLRRVFSKDERRTARSETSGYLESWKGLMRDRPSLGMLLFSFFTCMANDNLFVVYGAWLEEDFGLSVLAVGLGTSVIGASELCGEGLVAALSDKLGLKRSIFIGLVLSALSYAALPLVSETLFLALAGLFSVFLCYEFMIVTAMSLSTELLPGRRATMMSAFMAAAGGGRVVGALMGGPVWLAGGILYIGIISAILNGLAIVSLAWGLKPESERHEP